MTSHAGSGRSRRPSPPGPRIHRLSAHRTTSARARLHKPSISSPPLSAAHHDVVGPRAVFATPPCPHRCPPRRLHGHGQLPPRFGASRGAPRPLIPPDPRFSCVRIRAATYPPMAHSTPCCPHYACRRIADCVPATSIPVAGLPPPGAPPARPLACSPESGRAVGAGRRARPGPPDLPPTGRQAAPLAAERGGWTVGGVDLIARHAVGVVGRCMGRWRGATC